MVNTCTSSKPTINETKNTSLGHISRLFAHLPIMKFILLSLAVAAAFVLPARAADPIVLGPATANNHHFADWPEEVSAGVVEHTGGLLVIDYRVAAQGQWNGRAQVNLRDASGRFAAGLRSAYRAQCGGLLTELVTASGAQPVAADRTRVVIELPAGCYTLTACRATCPQLPENDVVGEPVGQAINIEATVR